MKKLLVGIFTVFLFFTTSTSEVAQTVIFNWETLKYYQTSCQWAQKCTVNFTDVDEKEAIKQIRKPCNICGG